MSFAGTTTLVLIVVIAALWLLATQTGALDRFNPTRSRVQLDTSVITSQTGRFHCRRPGHQDIDQIVALAQEPRTMLANGWTAQTAIENETFLRSRKFATFADLGLVAVSESGEVVGVGSVTMRPDHDDQVSIGIHTAIRHARQGVGTELMRAMILACRAGIPFEIWVGTATTNTSMQAIMTKLGHRPEPATEPYQLPSGETVESLWYNVS